LGEAPKIKEEKKVDINKAKIVVSAPGETMRNNTRMGLSAYGDNVIAGTCTTFRSSDVIAVMSFNAKMLQTPKLLHIYYNCRQT